eukprot:gnl/Carplike_NY0171/6232_a8557_203.p1 GENE.gnl/Carplike_NY0171/6232_a8557_203~~gnl/Carplike_NY0171/6232_a8557_203.p1  ORF type:complete len:271 (-),score=45.69 gnl/Carplike_NY0171/6232_a8557_203:24-836(-)
MPKGSKEKFEDYLAKHNIPIFLQDSLLVLLQNKPKDPIEFLFHYFDAVVMGFEHIDKAYRLISLSKFGDDDFLKNVSSAFFVLSEAPDGLVGKSLNLILDIIFKDIDVRWDKRIHDSLYLPEEEKLTLPIFINSICAAYSLLETITLSKLVFDGLDTAGMGLLSKDMQTELSSLVEDSIDIGTAAAVLPRSIHPSRDKYFDDSSITDVGQIESGKVRVPCNQFQKIFELDCGLMQDMIDELASDKQKTTTQTHTCTEQVYTRTIIDSLFE